MRKYLPAICAACLAYAALAWPAYRIASVNQPGPTPVFPDTIAAHGFLSVFVYFGLRALTLFRRPGGPLDRHADAWLTVFAPWPVLFIAAMVLMLVAGKFG